LASSRVAGEDSASVGTWARGLINDEGSTKASNDLSNYFQFRL